MWGCAGEHETNIVRKSLSSLCPVLFSWLLDLTYPSPALECWVMDLQAPILLKGTRPNSQTLDIMIHKVTLSPGRLHLLKQTHIHKKNRPQEYKCWQWQKTSCPEEGGSENTIWEEFTEGMMFVPSVRMTYPLSHSPNPSLHLALQPSLCQCPPLLEGHKCPLAIMVRSCSPLEPSATIISNSRVPHHPLPLGNNCIGILCLREFLFSQPLTMLPGSGVFFPKYSRVLRLQVLTPQPRSVPSASPTAVHTLWSLSSPPCCIFFPALLHTINHVFHMD